MKEWDCSDCIELWKAYAAAANNHVALIQAHSDAVANGDSERCDALEPAIEEAAFSRDQAWLSLQVHKAAPHAWVQENAFSC